MAPRHGRTEACLRDLLRFRREEAARTTQYTIRGVPAELERTLRRKAKLRKLSLNQVALDELAVATGATLKKADFSDLVGQWTPDPAFDEIMAMIAALSLESSLRLIARDDHFKRIPQLLRG